MSHCQRMNRNQKYINPPDKEGLHCPVYTTADDQIHSRTHTRTHMAKCKYSFSTNLLNRACTILDEDLMKNENSVNLW